MLPEYLFHLFWARALKNYYCFIMQQEELCMKNVWSIVSLFSAHVLLGMSLSIPPEMDEKIREALRKDDVATFSELITHELISLPSTPVDHFLEEAAQKQACKILIYLLDNHVIQGKGKADRLLELFSSGRGLVSMYFCGIAEEVVKELVRQGANLDHQVEGCPLACSCLELALSLNQAPVVEALLAHGAHPNRCCCCPNRSEYLGGYPLHFAVRSYNPSMVDILLARGARTDLKDRVERTPQELCNSLSLGMDEEEFQRMKELFEQHKRANNGTASWGVNGVISQFERMAVD
jgi:hypothetical protein